MKTIAPKLKLLGGIITCIIILSAFSINKEDKVAVCHNDKHTLVIPVSAVPGHLGHGDVIGICYCGIEDE